MGNERRSEADSMNANDDDDDDDPVTPEAEYEANEVYSMASSWKKRAANPVCH